MAEKNDKGSCLNLMGPVSAALHRHDLPFYLHRTKVSEAKKIIAKESGEKLTSKCLRKKGNAKLNTACSCFRCLVKLHCNYYLQIRRKPNSYQTELNAVGWDRLKLFVENNLKIMKGMTLEEGVEFVKTTMSTNNTQVTGLPYRLHFWKSPAKPD